MRKFRSRSAARPRFLRRPYRAFLKPLQTAQDTRNREVVLIALLATTLSLFVLLFVLLLLSFAVGNVQVGGRIVVCVVLIAALAGIYWIARRKRYWLAASLLTGFYALFAFGMIWQWGAGLPFSILLLSFIIVVTGILLGSRFALLSTIFAVCTLVGVQAAKELHWHTPDESWFQHASSLGDALGYAVIFVGLGLTSWLFGRQNEFSLRRASEAEADLLAEQAQLETRIEQRTLELQVAQFEEMQQMYRFAELGHLSAAMLHELANHLTVLTFNIDDMAQAQHSQALKRARHSIRYLEHMVDRVSMQLRGGEGTKMFSVPAKVNEVLALLKPKAHDHHVRLMYTPPTGKHSLKLRGDPIKFNQVLAVMVTNAIEAYDLEARKTGDELTVIIETVPAKDGVRIRVTDNGPGISEADQAKLFEPFFSTKKTGMGIGLFIARNMIEKYFNGTVAVTSRQGHTTFELTLPHESSQPHR